MPCYNVAPYKRLQRVLHRPCSYTAHATKQRTGLYRGFSCNLTNSTAHDTRPIQQAIAPPATRWSVLQRPDALCRYQIPPRRTLYSSAQTAYYNNVYKGAGGAPLLWIHARRRSISQTMPARRGQLLPSADRWQVLHPAHLLRGQRLYLSRASPAAGALAPGQRLTRTKRAPWHPPPGGQSSGGRRGTIDGSRRISFRAFARYLIEVSNSRNALAGIVVTVFGIVVANSRSFSDKIVVE